MRAGQNSDKELAAVNKDLAHMRQKLIEKIRSINTLGNNAIDIDINIIRKNQAKEIIFFNVLSGKRLKGIRYIPALFKGKLSTQDFLKGSAISFIALFIPSFFFPKLLKVYELLRRLKIIRF